MFKQFELIYLVGDGHDLIGLRVNHRDEEVFLYRLQITPESARQLFLVYLERINELAGQPEWYHLLTNSCTVNIVRYTNAVGRRGGFNIRHLLNGLISGYLYGAGFLDTSLTPACPTMSYVGAHASTKQCGSPIIHRIFPGAFANRCQGSLWKQSSRKIFTANIPIIILTYLSFKFFPGILMQTRNCFLMNLKPLRTVFLTSLLALLLISCGKKEEEKTEAIAGRPIKLMTVGSDLTGQTRKLPGTVRATKRVDLAFQVAGPLIELPVKEGQRVNRGDLIARIDPQYFETSLRNAKGTMARAKAAVDYAVAEYQRFRNVKATDAGATAKPF